jgi:hypothetical protein
MGQRRRLHSKKGKELLCEKRENAGIIGEHSVDGKETDILLQGWSDNAGYVKLSCELYYVCPDHSTELIPSPFHRFLF